MNWDETAWVRGDRARPGQGGCVTDEAPADRRPAGAPGDDRGLEPYEVFRQEKDGGPMVHGGNVIAPDAELAVHYAREMYGRRQESVRLWVVRALTSRCSTIRTCSSRRSTARSRSPAATSCATSSRSPRARSGAAKTAERLRSATGIADGPVPSRPDATRLALLLLAMADDEFVIGFSDSEWTGIAPMLEEDVAMSSLAQDELGHARPCTSCWPRWPTTARRRRGWPSIGHPPATTTHGCSTIPAAIGRRRSPSVPV